MSTHERRTDINQNCRSSWKTLLGLVRTTNTNQPSSCKHEVISFGLVGAQNQANLWKDYYVSTRPTINPKMTSIKNLWVPYARRSFIGDLQVSRLPLDVEITPIRPARFITSFVSPTQIYDEPSRVKVSNS